MSTGPKLLTEEDTVVEGVWGSSRLRCVAHDGMESGSSRTAADVEGWQGCCGEHGG